MKHITAAVAAIVMVGLGAPAADAKQPPPKCKLISSTGEWVVMVSGDRASRWWEITTVSRCRGELVTTVARMRNPVLGPR